MSRSPFKFQRIYINYAIAVNQGIAKITMEEHDRKRRRDELQSQLQQHLDSQQEEAEYDQQLQDEMHAMATIAYSMTVDDDTSEEEDDKPKWGGITEVFIGTRAPVMVCLWQERRR
jgi:hypothetical protein